MRLSTIRVDDVLKFDLEKFRISESEKIDLRNWDPDDTSNIPERKSDAKDEVEELKEKLAKMQEVLYAEHKHKILIILQGMDAAGKDSTIGTIFEGVNPEGVRVSNFKQPTQEELDHDFLWRIHKEAPGKGEIMIFNRSHYESVLIEKVHNLTPKKTEELRYGEINDFERMLTSEGTTILKFFLHISEAVQKKKFEERLDDPAKEWKFSQSDLAERSYWKEYMKAYEKMLERTSTEWAPWYVVPSNHKWFRDYIVVSAIVEELEKLHMSYPKLAERDKKSAEESIALK
jgi:PPK2 family polyphosphate:nucleotide phosphotransferase